MVARDVSDSIPQMKEMFSGIGRRRADRCCDLDLGALKFCAEMLSKSGPAFFEHALRWLADERSRPRIDEKIFLLDAERERGLFMGRHCARLRQYSGVSIAPGIRVLSVVRNNGLVA
jgi:hypothetical protein